MTLTLFGTTTSPYVRKIRILLRHLPVGHELVDTRTPEGAARLAEVAPLGKIPVLLAGDQVLPDSTLIAHWLWATFPGELRAAGFSLDPLDFDDRALQLVVEGALDAGINRFYLLKDVPDTGYVRKQGDRVITTLRWLDGRVRFGGPITHATLSLGVALDWMAFRHVVDFTDLPGIRAFHEGWRASGLGAGSEPG